MPKSRSTHRSISKLPQRQVPCLRSHLLASFNGPWALLHSVLTSLVKPPLTYLSQANTGLRIGGEISGGSPLVDAQLVGFVNTTLSFQASASASFGTGGSTAASYRYGVYPLYNLGHGAYATIKFFPNWANAVKPRQAYSPSKRFTIYENTGSFSGPTKRSINAPLAIPAPKSPRRGLVDDWPATELTALDHVHTSHWHDRDIDVSQSASSAASRQSLLGKRADDNLHDSQQADFTSQLTCPPGDTGQIRISDYRRKSLEPCGDIDNCTDIRTQSNMSSVAKPRPRQ